MGYHTVFMHYALAGGESKERYCQIFVRGFPVKERNPDGELCWKATVYVRENYQSKFTRLGTYLYLYKYNDKPGPGLHWVSTNGNVYFQFFCEDECIVNRLAECMRLSAKKRPSSVING